MKLNQQLHKIFLSFNKSNNLSLNSYDLSKYCTLGQIHRLHYIRLFFFFFALIAMLSPFRSVHLLFGVLSVRTRSVSHILYSFLLIDDFLFWSFYRLHLIISLFLPWHSAWGTLLFIIHF